MTEAVYLIQNSADLHTLFVRFSHLKSFLISRIFDEYERSYPFVSQTLYKHFTSCCVVSDIKFLAFGSSLYIRYNTAAHVVNIVHMLLYRIYIHYIRSHFIFRY